MTTYTFTAPPHFPGIYLIRNTVTGQIYIGQSMDLRRRYNEWRSVFISALGVKSFKLLGAIQDGDPSHWTFTVIIELPGATREQLSEYESKAITRAFDKSPDKVLNTTRDARPRQAGNTPKSVVTLEGQVVAYSVAAQFLGTSVKQLQKRLAKHRAKGVTEVVAEDLKVLNEKYGLKN